MSLRGQELYDTADRQITALAALLSQAGSPPLSKPCPGREKLGDGTIAAVAAHTADRYHRIAGYIAVAQGGLVAPSPSSHDATCVSMIDLHALSARLQSARGALAVIIELGDERLDSVPPAGAMRFADGQRTLEQVIASLLKHQGHQVHAIASALT